MPSLVPRLRSPISHSRDLVLFVVVSLGCVLLLLAESGLADEVNYQRDIRPILSDHCFKCHGPDAASREGGLRLDLEDSAMEGGDSGDAAIVPGDPAASELIRRVMTDDEDELMPPPDMKHPLNAEQRSLLSDWVELGGKYDDHWSFGPIERPQPVTDTLPENRNNAIDLFVAQQLAASELTSNGPADRYRLIRRLSLDLTGLPPTPEEADAFAEDSRPDAVERLVDRLLASPAYGERMAWDWLDAARYADSNGYQGDNDRTMWPWRDWVISAFNEDLNFADFSRWQIAGDLLPDANLEQQLATGFFRNHMINGEGGRIPAENRVDYVMDMTETFGTVWLGLTMNCCRCHDHKYDPLTQKDYFSLFAFFNQTPVDGAGGNPQTPPVLRVPSESQQDQLTALQATRETALQELEAWQKEAQADEQLAESINNLDIKMRELDQGKWDQWIKENPELPESVTTSVARVKEALSKRDQIERSIPKVMVLRDQAEYRPTFLLSKGLYNQPLDETSAATPGRFASLAEDVPADRLALANWLFEDQQPLTARVTANRLWQQLFGIGIVKTAEDFGTQGEWPSHQQLLDWLAAELRRDEWSTKRWLRTVLTSSTYQRSSDFSPEALEWDPENRLLSHGSRFRMPSWMIRDQALFASGLFAQRVGGPPTRPYQPEGVWQDATFGKKKYQPGQGSELYRRSLYTFWRRIIAPTMFFDAASRQTCTVKLSRTNTPLHALTLLNGVIFVEAGRELANVTMLQAPAADPDEWIRSAFRQVLIRPPSQEEVEFLRKSFDRIVVYYHDHPEEANELLDVGNSPARVGNEIDPITLAALTALCNGLFNLDEAISKE